MNKIQIVNWLLTRKCNLSCGYCALVKNYDNMPKEYPKMSHYHKNEVVTCHIINFLNKLKLHNPNIFIIFYGGEPLLRKDLPEIISHCNDNDINYTIISNCTEEVQPLLDNLIKKVGVIKGFSASIDPILMHDCGKADPHEFLKTNMGFATLKRLKDKNIVKDLVAEVTVSNENLQYLYSLIKFLTKNGINSDITFIDEAKSEWYDFSNVTDCGVKKSESLKNTLNLIIEENLNVHMSKTLLPKIYDILPSELDCEIDKDLHNICVDADGSMRLCLRINGVVTPNNINIENCFDENNEISKTFIDAIKNDKLMYCKKCNHTCLIMSKLISENLDCVEDLIHKDIRNE